jgi:hypothetical protein
MCCGPESHHGGWPWGLHQMGFCACGMPFRFGPRFLTKEEKTTWLERYLEGLREEVKAVEQHIAELKEEE